jgi:predicted ATPase/DNA-binding NarL/FixJ family response regulator
MNLPVDLTPFIGRSRELEALSRLLSDPDCHLITLVGLGGSGKTRLAIEAARKNAALYADGVYFVALQPLSSADFLLSALADSLHYSLRGSDEQGQLLDYLQHKSLLFVLDNFEHLLAATDLLSLILMHAPGVRLLVTSREVLNLREEWLFPVPGLGFPTDAAAADLEQFEAVQLFLAYARRVQRDFSFQAEQEHVVRLCQLVEGMPLALELAASWLKSLPCSAIISEIQRNLDFLNTPLRNLPARHRSMRTVFEQSWKLLSDEERQVFRRLSVFQGGFRREAAEVITGTRLHTLSALVDKSLVRYEPTGRYHLHELLCQFAGEQLSHDPEELRETEAKHISYYIALLHQREADLNSAHLLQVIAELEADLDNIRAAWGRAIRDGNITAIRSGTDAYYTLSDIQGRYQEWHDACEKAIQRLCTLEPSEARDLALAALHTDSGAIFIRLGQFEQAQTRLEESMALYEQHDRRPPPGFGNDPIAVMGLLACTVGQYAEAMVFAEQALQRTAPEDDRNRMFTLYVLANATYSLGQFEQAMGQARKAYQISSGLSDIYFGSYILIVLGNIAQALEDYDQAHEYYQTSYQLKEEYGEQVGMAFALNCMAHIAWMKLNYQEAKRCFQQGHDLYEKMNDPGGLATSILGLGDTAHAQEDYPLARSYFRQAMEIALEIHWTPLILSILTGVSELLLKEGDAVQSARLIKRVITHPATEVLTRKRAERLLGQANNAPGSADEEGDLESIAAAVLDHLKFPTRTVAVTPVTVRPAVQGLIDELSERELEILALLAAGFTNQEIAEKLTVVLGTVKAHNHHIFRKLDVTNRVQAITRARELNLI